MKRLSTHKNAFTLVELLVVITIITILIAVLLPALQAAREASKEIQCLSNLRQVMTALYSYSIDHDELPRGRWYVAPSELSWSLAGVKGSSAYPPAGYLPLD